MIKGLLLIIGILIGIMFIGFAFIIGLISMIKLIVKAIKD